MKKALSVTAVAVALLLQGCSMDQTQQEAKPLMSVSTFEVAPPHESQFRYFNGLVVPADQTPLAFRLAGEVVWLNAKEGQKVAEGDLLATLDDRKIRQQLSDASAQYKLAKNQLKRAKELYGRGMVSQAEFDELNANLKLAKAQYQNQSKQLEYTQLRAPFDGVIASVSVEKFESAAAGNPVISLYRDDKVYVQIQLSDTVLAMLNPDDRERVYRPDVTFTGYSQSWQMRYLEHTSEPAAQSKSYEMWLEMDQVTPSILPGTPATVEVDMAAAGLGVESGYRLPMTALEAGSVDGQFYVWKWQDGRVNRSPVLVDMVTGDGALVSRGVSEGDVLVTSSLRKLREGQEVNNAGSRAQ